MRFLADITGSLQEPCLQPRDTPLQNVFKVFPVTYEVLETVTENHLREEDAQCPANQGERQCRSQLVKESRQYILYPDYQISEYLLYGGIDNATGDAPMVAGTSCCC